MITSSHVTGLWHIHRSVASCLLTAWVVHVCLQELVIAGAGALRGLPEDLGALSSLNHLSLSYCHCFERLPDSIGKLANLQVHREGSLGQGPVPEGCSHANSFTSKKHTLLARASVGA